VYKLGYQALGASHCPNSHTHCLQSQPARQGAQQPYSSGFSARAAELRRQTLRDKPQASFLGEGLIQPQGQLPTWVELTPPASPTSYLTSKPSGQAWHFSLLLHLVISSQPSPSWQSQSLPLQSLRRGQAALPAQPKQMRSLPALLLPPPPTLTEGASGGREGKSVSSQAGGQLSHPPPTGASTDAPLPIHKAAATSVCTGSCCTAPC
jgi:hypothetical protein